MPTKNQAAMTHFWNEGFIEFAIYEGRLTDLRLWKGFQRCVDDDDDDDDWGVTLDF